MSDANSALITRFYQAFQRLDAEAMVACYSDDIVFSDPVFGTCLLYTSPSPRDS